MTDEQAMTNWIGVYSGSSAGSKDARMETERLSCDKCGGLQEQCICPDPDAEGEGSNIDICGAVNKYNHYMCDLTPPGHRGFHAAWRLNGRGESYNELWPHASCRDRDGDQEESYIERGKDRDEWKHEAAEQQRLK